MDKKGVKELCSEVVGSQFQRRRALEVASLLAKVGSCLSARFHGGKSVRQRLQNATVP